jgi:cellulose synthase/poly-beta-1,6-N-acetylglucosamine synthase-like glycosyltransferase
MSFELLVSYHRFLAGSSPIGHLQRHVFYYWWQFPLIFILSWYFFQKFSLRNSMIVAWILGALFESLFIAKSIFGIFSGLLWVWILTSCWMMVKYIVEH